MHHCITKKWRKTMKHINLKKAVEKHAPVHCLKESDKQPYYYAQLEGIIISWFTPFYERESAVCVNVRHKEDKHDFVSDYHAGAYYDTIKSAIKALNYKYNLNRGIAQ
jgi:hypothetical protein